MAKKELTCKKQHQEKQVKRVVNHRLVTKKVQYLVKLNNLEEWKQVHQLDNCKEIIYDYIVKHKNKDLKKWVEKRFYKTQISQDCIIIDDSNNSDIDVLDKITAKNEHLNQNENVKDFYEIKDNQSQEEEGQIKIQGDQRNYYPLSYLKQQNQQSQYLKEEFIDAGIIEAQKSQILCLIDNKNCKIKQQQIKKVSTSISKSIQLSINRQPSCQITIYPKLKQAQKQQKQLNIQPQRVNFSVNPSKQLKLRIIKCFKRNSQLMFEVQTINGVEIIDRHQLKIIAPHTLIHYYQKKMIF